MIMADQDQDGSHIKGLLINFVHHFWPELLKISGFLVEFITPIVKATKGKTEKVYTLHTNSMRSMYLPEGQLTCNHMHCMVAHIKLLCFTVLFHSPRVCELVPRTRASERLQDSLLQR